MEAISHGLPVVVTDQAGVSMELIHGESGIIVPARSVDALEDAMKRLGSDPELCSRLAANAWERGRWVTWARYRDEVQSRYAENGL
jgi:glycosyltransferase involved in cell wall biosynthesis